MEDKHKEEPIAEVSELAQVNTVPVINFEELCAPIPAASLLLRPQGKPNASGKRTILVYKDARIDANRLDSVVGPMNWKRSHYEVSGVNYCKVSLRDPATGEWVGKSDAGTESNADAEKGQASDAFKRACFQWGIGRELYNYPLIRVEEEYVQKLSYCKTIVVMFQGTKDIAAMAITLNGKVIFQYKHQDYVKGTTPVTQI